MDFYMSNYMLANVQLMLALGVLTPESRDASVRVLSFVLHLTSPARPLITEGKHVIQVPEKRFLCSPWRRLWWHKFSPCSPWRLMVELISTLQPVQDPTLQQVEMPWRMLKPVDSPSRNRFSGRNCSPRGTALEQSVPEGLYLMEQTHAGAVCKGLYSMGGTPRWSRSTLWEEKSTEMKCYELTTNPIFHPPCTTPGVGGGRRIRNEGVKFSLRRRIGIGVFLVLSLFLTMLLDF